MNYYLVTKPWRDGESTRNYWRFDTLEEAANAEVCLGGTSNDFDPQEILEVEGVIPHAREGTDLYDLEPGLFEQGGSGASPGVGVPER